MRSYSLAWNATKVLDELLLPWPARSWDARHLLLTLAGWLAASVGTPSSPFLCDGLQSLWGGVWEAVSWPLKTMSMWPSKKKGAGGRLFGGGCSLGALSLGNYGEFCGGPLKLCHDKQTKGLSRVGQWNCIRKEFVHPTSSVQSALVCISHPFARNDGTRFILVLGKTRVMDILNYKRNC